MPTPLRFGIDLGGTKIEIAALGADGRELLRRRIATPNGDYEAILLAVAGLVQEAESELRCRASVGIGTPGSISRTTNLLQGSNTVCLNGQPIKRDLETLLSREIRITNDANCFALSEATDGAGKGQAMVFGAILGTGVGAGIVVNSRVLEGRHGIAGEWGHNPLPWPKDEERPGPACFCGQSGCIETWLSGPAIERDHSETTREWLSPREIAIRAARGDPACAATMLRYEDRFARAISHVINLLDPDVIVLGGGMSNVDALYANVPHLWGRWVFAERVHTKLVRHAHGDSSGVRGAAWLWNEN